jgi:predicted RNA binding protein YcfA (HicA-like mRNA interferase family)
MKRGDFLKHLKANSCERFREGKKHTVFINTRNNKKVTVPRHNELHNDFCREICKQLEIPFLRK